MLKTVSFLMLFFPIYVMSQNNNIGNVEIIQDARIDDLVNTHIAINKKFKQNGYRIQIFFDSGNNSKSAAYKAKSDFLTLYPDIESYVVFESPYYKVRVGNFRTRLDAQRFLNVISSHYTNAFIVKDVIDYPQL